MSAAATATASEAAAYGGVGMSKSGALQPQPPHGAAAAVRLAYTHDGIAVYSTRRRRRCTRRRPPSPPVAARPRQWRCARVRRAAQAQARPTAQVRRHGRAARRRATLAAKGCGRRRRRRRPVSGDAHAAAGLLVGPGRVRRRRGEPAGATSGSAGIRARATSQEEGPAAGLRQQTAAAASAQEGSSSRYNALSCALFVVATTHFVLLYWIYDGIPL